MLLLWVCGGRAIYNKFVVQGNVCERIHARSGECYFSSACYLSNASTYLGKSRYCSLPGQERSNSVTTSAPEFGMRY